MDYGIDVSNYQGSSINWNAVRGNGISFTSVLLTDGTNFLNPDATNQVNGARSAGIACGGYHYARPVDIGSQVNTFVDQLSARGLLDDGSLLPMLDMEADGFGDPNGFVSEFINQFRARTGTDIIVFANLNWLTHVINANLWAGDGVWIWLSLYNGDPGNLGGYSHPRVALHQHTDQGVVPGINGYVDRDETINGVSLTDLLVKKGDDFLMALEEWKQERIFDRVMSMSQGVEGQSFAGDQFVNEQGQRDALAAQVKAISDKVDSLSSQVAALAQQIKPTEAHSQDAAEA
ncbi:MAG: glycoside hydrolase family 25 protein [Kutzneria sp.]|nr:glycoside hydrolase family 25 protein [Kutzneria sp.]